MSLSAPGEGALRVMSDRTGLLERRSHIPSHPPLKKEGTGVMPKPKKHVFVCNQSRPPGHPRGSCGAKGTYPLLQAFQQQFERRSLYPRFALTASGCLGPCDRGANVLVYPEGVMYNAVSKEDVTAIIEEHLVAGVPVQRLQATPDVWG